MKRTFCILLSVIMLLTFETACSDGTAQNQKTVSDYIQLEALGISCYCFDSIPETIAVYKNIVFSLSDGKISRTDISAGVSEKILDLQNVLCLGCDSLRLLVVGKSFIGAYDYDGSEIFSVSLENEIEDVSRAAFWGDDVIYSVYESGGHNLYITNKDSGKTSKLPDTWKRNAKDALVVNLSSSKDTIKINYAYNHSWAGWSTALVEYDKKADKIISDTSEEGHRYTYGCFGADGDFYYPHSRSSADDNTFYQYIASLERGGNVMCISSDMLSTPYSMSNSIYMEYADGTSFVIYDSANGVILSAGMNSSENPIVIMGLESDEYDELIARYIAKTGRQVQTLSYSAETYNDRLRTKLLAGDYDFDLYIADNAVLRSVLENSAFEPLDGYNGISDNFDNLLATGVRGLVSHKDKLFGVPLTASCYNAFNLCRPYDIPDNWTVEDMFDISRSMDGSGYKLFFDRYQLTQIVKCYIQDMISKDGEINKDELEQFFAKLKEHNDKGVLCDGEGLPILSYGLTCFMSINLNLYSDSMDLCSGPTRSGTRYITLERTLLMNPASKNKDGAADFLAYMTSEETIYDNNALRIFIGKNTNKNSDYNELDKAKLDLLDFTMGMYERSSYTTIDSTELPEFIASSIVFPLLDGEITPKKAVDMIVDEVAYVYFE